MNIEEAKLNIGKQVKVNNTDALNSFWHQRAISTHKIILGRQINDKIFELLFQDSNGNTLFNLNVDIYYSNLSLVDQRKFITFEQARENIGKEVKFNDPEQLSEYWKKAIRKCNKIIIAQYAYNDENSPIIKLNFKDKLDRTFDFIIVNANKIDISLVDNMQGMTIEQARSNIGAEVELLEHTKPYMKNQSESIANVESENKPSKLIISKVTDGIVTIVSPENHLYNLNPEHIAFKKVIKHLDIQSVVLGDGISMIEKLKQLSKKRLSLPNNLSIDALKSIAKDKHNMAFFYVKIESYSELKTVENYFIEKGFTWLKDIDKSEINNYKCIFIANNGIYASKGVEIAKLRRMIEISFKEFEQIYLSDDPIVLGDADPLKDKIKKLALSAGFKLKKQKNGTMDLNEYVYDFAKKLLNGASIVTDDPIASSENVNCLENDNNKNPYDVTNKDQITIDPDQLKKIFNNAFAMKKGIALISAVNDDDDSVIISVSASNFFNGNCYSEIVSFLSYNNSHEAADAIYAFKNGYKDFSIDDVYIDVLFNSSETAKLESNLRNAEIEFTSINWLEPFTRLENKKLKAFQALSNAINQNRLTIASERNEHLKGLIFDSLSNTPDIFTNTHLSITQTFILMFNRLNILCDSGYKPDESNKIYFDITNSDNPSYSIVIDHGSIHSSPDFKNSNKAELDPKPAILNVNDAFYASYNGEEVEVFDFDRWVSIDELTVGHARSRTQFRIKPKKVFIKADDYSKQELLEIIADNFK